MKYSNRSLFLVVAVIAIYLAMLVRMPAVAILLSSFVPLLLSVRYAVRSSEGTNKKFLAFLLIASVIPAYVGIGPPLSRGSS